MGFCRGQAEKEFRVEVEAIGHVRHKNLVRLLGYCVEGIHRYFFSRSFILIIFSMVLRILELEVTVYLYYSIFFMMCMIVEKTHNSICLRVVIL